MLWVVDFCLSLPCLFQMRHADFLKKRKLYYSFRFWVFLLFARLAGLSSRLATCNACILSKTFTAQTVQCSRPAAAAGIWNIIRKSKKIRTSQPSLSRASLSAVQIHPALFRQTVQFSIVLRLDVCVLSLLLLFCFSWSYFLSSLIFLFYIE